MSSDGVSDSHDSGDGPAAGHSADEARRLNEECERLNLAVSVAWEHYKKALALQRSAEEALLTLPRKESVGAQRALDTQQRVNLGAPSAKRLGGFAPMTKAVSDPVRPARPRGRPCPPTAS
jgi:hypothetical protein